MEIKGKVHCFFEQSGTFKNEFIKLGIPAEDYDIQNHFGQTDHVIDLFAEIEKAYDDQPSVFDDITPDDLIMAFFPCIYFCSNSQMAFTMNNQNYKTLTTKQTTDAIIERAANRERLYVLAIKMLTTAKVRGLRLIMENPATQPHYLLLPMNFITTPRLIDTDRTRRGDYRIKPTAYWFVNCDPTQGMTIEQTPLRLVKTHSDIKRAEHAGICSEERSMISPDYARNFICDFIIGKVQKHTQLNLFEQ